MMNPMQQLAGWTGQVTNAGNTGFAGMFILILIWSKKIFIITFGLKTICLVQ